MNKEKRIKERLLESPENLVKLRNIKLGEMRDQPISELDAKMRILNYDT